MRRFFERLVNGGRRTEVRGAIGMPCEALHTRRAKSAATLVRFGVCVINDPVLFAVGRLKESIVTRAESLGLRICA